MRGAEASYAGDLGTSSVESTGVVARDPGCARGTEPATHEGEAAGAKLDV